MKMFYLTIASVVLLAACNAGSSSQKATTAATSSNESVPPPKLLLQSFNLPRNNNWVTPGGPFFNATRFPLGLP